MEKFDVAICGYGPVGATLSLLLAKYDYKVLIIEKNQGPCKTARAINTDGEQLRIFDQFNVAERVIANSNQIDRKSTRLNSSHSQQSRMPSSA